MSEGRNNPTATTHQTPGQPKKKMTSKEPKGTSRTIRDKQHQRRNKKEERKNEQQQQPDTQGTKLLYSDRAISHLSIVNPASYIHIHQHWEPKWTTLYAWFPPLYPFEQPAPKLGG
jgi:hypothetical protein